MRRVRPALVHTNSMKAHVLAAPAARLARVPLIWHVRDILEDDVVGRTFARLARGWPTNVLCISRAVASSLERSKPNPRCRVVYNGIDVRPARPGDATAWRESLEVANDDVLVGIVGQIAHWKGQDVFMEAAALLAATRRGIRFVVVGECLFPENEGDYEFALHQRAARADLEGRVVLTGPVTPIEPVMAALDVCVHASRLPEPFGRVIVEALSQGTPVITTTIGAGPELVPEDVGRQVPPGDVNALAAAIAEVADAPDMRVAMAERCRVAAQRFTITTTAENVLAVYRSLGVLS